VIAELAPPAAFAVAVVFAWAAISKLRNPASTDAAVAAFGLPNVVSPLLVPAEFAVASALILRPVLGAVFAVCLLGGFCVVVVRAIRTDTPVQCGCFGGSDDRVIGVDSLLRNLGLIALASAVVAGPNRFYRPSAVGSLVVCGGFAIGTLSLALLRVRMDVGSLFSQQLPRHDDLSVTAAL
jgi:Methylamine utilisation protein MauE